MHQRIRAFLCAIVASAIVHPAFADAPVEESSLAIAIEMYVDPVLAVRAPEMDPTRYETYVRELLRGIVPAVSLVTEQDGARNASHVFVIDVAPAEQRGMVRVTVSVKLGRGVTRRMELSRVATATIAAGDAATFETFLRQQVIRVAELYQLRRDGTARSDAHAVHRTAPAAELGMTLAINAGVPGPSAEAVGSAIRTTLAEELPGVTLVGPFGPGEDGSSTRPMLAVEFARMLDPEQGRSPATAGRSRARVILTDRERGEILRADEVYDDGDAERALRFLRETIRTVAGKLLEDPLLFPLASAGADVPIDRDWDDPDHAPVETAHTGTPADVSTRASPPLPRWQRIVRVSEIAVAGLGAVTIGLGVWQGLAARTAASEYRSARIQLDAEDAKQRSEDHAQRANQLFALGTAAVVLGGTSIVLDVFGVYRRWSGHDRRTSTVTIIPADHGIVGAWTVLIP